MITKTQRFFKDRIILLIALITLVLFFYSFFIVKKDTIFADGSGYFSYPYEFFKTGNLNYTGLESQYTFGVQNLDGANLNKYPIGTGIFLTPAFLATEVFTVVSGASTKTVIFASSYQFFVGIFGIIYFLIGLLILKKILLRFFSSGVTNITLLGIALGTNVFVYASVDSSFSHIYSFLCINLFILFLIKWNELPNKLNSIILGIATGLVLLVRQSNITILILFLLYGIEFNSFKSSLKNRVYFIKNNINKVLIIPLIALLVLFPQILYWFAQTGRVFIFSYGKESFDFLKPEILNVLFSIKRGLLFWHPIILISLLGLKWVNKKIPKLTLGLVLFLFVNLYVIASWWMWDYGIGFGHRAFTDYMGIFAILFASFLSYIWQKKSQNKKEFTIFIIGILITVNFILAISYIQQRNSSPEAAWNSYIKSFTDFHL